MESSVKVVKDRLSFVEEKLSQTPPVPLPVASTQPLPPPSSPVTEPEPTTQQQPSLSTVTTPSNVDGTTSSTALNKEDDSKSSSTGDGRNTNVPTGEPTTPLTESTESRGTGATGDLPQTEGPAMLNVSSEASDEGMANSTEGVITATMEGGTSTTTEGTPDSEDNGEKTTNEQAIAALQSE